MVIADCTRTDLQKAKFIFHSCDEVTTIEYQSWLSVTAYTSMLEIKCAICCKCLG
jgi:hypothetical protein